MTIQSVIIGKLAHFKVMKTEARRDVAVARF